MLRDALALSLCLALLSFAAGEYCLTWTLYDKDFEGPLGDEWSVPGVSADITQLHPTSWKALGPLETGENGKASLSLTNIPLHSKLDVELTLAFASGRDGLAKDAFNISVDDLPNADLVWWGDLNGIGVPDSSSSDDDGKNNYVDVVWTTSFSIDHTADQSTLDFGITNSPSRSEEAAYILNITVSLTHCFEPDPVCNLEKRCKGTCDAVQSTFEQWGSWAVDEIFDDSTTTCMKTAVATEDEQVQYLMVDLDEYRLVGTVRFVSEGAEGDFMVKVSSEKAGSGQTYDLNNQLVDAQNPTFGGKLPDANEMEGCNVKAMGGGVFEATCPPATKGHYVYVMRAAAKTALEVCDFEVFSFECMALNEAVGCPMGSEPANCTSRCSGCVPCQPGFYSDKEGAYTCTPCPGVSLNDISGGLIPGSYSPPGSTSVFQCEGDLYVDGTSTLDVVPGGVFFDQALDAWHIDVMYSQASHIQVNGLSTLYLSDGGDDFEEDIYTAAAFPCRADSSEAAGADLSVSLEETMCCLQSMRQDYVMTKIFRDWTDGLDLVAANDRCDASDGSDLLVNADLSVVGEGTEFVGVDGSSFASKITIEPIAAPIAVPNAVVPPGKQCHSQCPGIIGFLNYMTLVCDEADSEVSEGSVSADECSIFSDTCCNSMFCDCFPQFLMELVLLASGEMLPPDWEASNSGASSGSAVSSSSDDDWRRSLAEAQPEDKLKALREIRKIRHAQRKGVTERRSSYYEGMQYARITIPDAELYKVSRHASPHQALPVDDDDTTYLTDQRELFIGLLDMLPTGTRVVDSANQQISIKLTRTQYGSFAAYGEQNIDYDFISYLNARVHRVLSSGGPTLYEAEITYVYDDRLSAAAAMPVEDLNSVSVSVPGVPGYEGFRTCAVGKLSEFQTTVEADCGPKELDWDAGCPQVSLPDDKFGRLYVPLPVDFETDASAISTISIAFALSFTDAGGKTAELPVSMDIAVGDFVSWCDQETGSVDLAERVIPAITIGTSTNNPPRLTAFSDDQEDFSTGAETLQDGLITLELSLDETDGLDDNLEVFMEDVLVVQINPGSPLVDIDDFAEATGPYVPTYTYDPDTRDATLNIPEALKEACPEAMFSESFFGCVHKHVLAEEEVTNPEWSYLVGSADDVASTGAQDFMETMLGSGTAAVAARELGRDYEEYLEGQQGFGTRKKVGLWINPGHEWGQTVHNSEYSLSEWVVVYVLFGVRSGVDGTTRRMLLQATGGGRTALLQKVKYQVTASTLVEEALGEGVDATEVRAALSLSQEEACRPQAELVAWCAQTLAQAVAPHASAIRAVQCVAVEVMNADCANNRRAGSSPTAVVDAVIALAASADAKLDMRAVVASGAVLSMQRTGGRSFQGAIEQNDKTEEEEEEEEEEDGGSSDNGMIIGAAAGAVAGVVLLAGAAWKLSQRRREPEVLASEMLPNVENQKARVELIMFNDAEVASRL